MEETVTNNTRDRLVYLSQSTSENGARLKRIKHIVKVIKALSVRIFRII